MRRILYHCAEPRTDQWAVLRPTSPAVLSSCIFQCSSVSFVARWHSGRMLDLWSIGHGFDSQPPRCLVQLWASCKHTCASVTKQYNLVPDNGRQCLATGKVTVGLVSHRPHVTDISGSPPTDSRQKRGRWAPTYALMVDFTSAQS